MLNFKTGRKSGKPVADLVQAFSVAKSNQIEKHIEKMLYMAGFTRITNPMNYNPISNIDQIKKFIEDNDIKLKMNKFEKDTIYTMSKNGEDILFFIERTEYDLDNYKINISLSDIKEI